MISESQLKNLIKAHNNRNYKEFRSIVLKIAEKEELDNNLAFSKELRNLVKINRSTKTSLPLVKDYIITKYEPNEKFSDLIVSRDIYVRLRRLINEYRKSQQSEKLNSSSIRKILFDGVNGTGKTFTASVIAAELNLPLYVVQLDKLVQKYMKDTDSKLRNIFRSINKSVGVYLFDELDDFCIIDDSFVRSFLHFIEQDFSNSIIIIITNNKKIICNSSLSTFDEIIHFKRPTEEEIEHIYKSILTTYQEDFVASAQLIFQSQLLSHGEIAKVCYDAIKESLSNNMKISEARVLSSVKERTQIF